jgi:hypothetical protein
MDLMFFVLFGLSFIFFFSAGTQLQENDQMLLERIMKLEETIRKLSGETDED